MSDTPGSVAALAAPADILQREIYRAQTLCARFGSALGTDCDVQAALNGYREAISKTRGLMLDVGVEAGCRRCAEENNGSCCFHSMEEHIEHMLLLINLLWGEDLPGKREVPDHCWFLGRHGCKLFARYHFCVNYFCADLKSRLLPAQWKTLLATVGTELSAGWHAEHVLGRWLGARL